jgi:hypothetical protein
MLIRLPFYILIFVFLLAARPIAARDKSEPVEYDIFQREDRLSVRLNLAQYLSSRRVERMKEGIDLAIEYRLVLSRPKRFWGAEEVAKSSGLVKIGYRIVTEDFSLSAGKFDPGDDRHFVSLARLHQFLSDSIVVDLAAYKELSPRRRYVLKIKLTCISLTNFNLAANGDPSEEPGSPVKYLFTHFLRLTGFGREEYSIQTRPFSLSEISSEN